MMIYPFAIYCTPYFACSKDNSHQLPTHSSAATPQLLYSRLSFFFFKKKKHRNTSYTNI